MSNEDHPGTDDDRDPAADEARGLGAPRLRDAPHLLVVEGIQSTRELMGLVLKCHYETQMAATYEQASRRSPSTRREFP